MAVFSKHEVMTGNPLLIPEIAKSMDEEFSADGFEVVVDSLLSGGYDISITKGDYFKAVLGMKTALKVTLMPHPNGISFDANVGIFGEQVIPTVISMFFFWPVLITQIWGLVKQSKLDDKSLDICRKVIATNADVSKSAVVDTVQRPVKFCTNCGTQLQSDVRFCSNCGAKTE